LHHATVQRLWREVCPVGPDDGPEFVVEFNLSEEIWILEWSEDATPRAIGQFDLTFVAVFEAKP